LLNAVLKTGDQFVERRAFLKMASQDDHSNNDHSVICELCYNAYGPMYDGAERQGSGCAGYLCCPLNWNDVPNCNAFGETIDIPKYDIGGNFGKESKSESVQEWIVHGQFGSAYDNTVYLCTPQFSIDAVCHVKNRNIIQNAKCGKHDILVCDQCIDWMLHQNNLIKIGTTPSIHASPIQVYRNYKHPPAPLKKLAHSAASTASAACVSAASAEPAATAASTAPTPTPTYDPVDDTMTDLKIDTSSAIHSDSDDDQQSTLPPWTKGAYPIVPFSDAEIKQRESIFGARKIYRVKLSCAYGGSWGWESTKNLQVIASDVMEAQRLAMSYLQQYAAQRHIDFDKQVKWIANRSSMKNSFPGMTDDGSAWCEGDARFCYGGSSLDKDDQLEHRQKMIKNGELDDDDAKVSLSKDELDERDSIILAQKKFFDQKLWQRVSELNDKASEKLYAAVDPFVKGTVYNTAQQSDHHDSKDKCVLDWLRHRARVRMGLWSIANTLNFEVLPMSAVLPSTNVSAGE